MEGHICCHYWKLDLPVNHIRVIDLCDFTPHLSLSPSDCSLKGGSRSISKQSVISRLIPWWAHADLCQTKLLEKRIWTEEAGTRRELRQLSLEPIIIYHQKGRVSPLSVLSCWIILGCLIFHCGAQTNVKYIHCNRSLYLEWQEDREFAFMRRLIHVSELCNPSWRMVHYSNEMFIKVWRFDF